MWRSIVSTITGLTPAAGSSSSTSRGSPIRSEANSSSLRWPNESDPARSCATWVSPNSSSRASAALALGTPQRLAQQRSPGLLERDGEVLEHREIGEHPRPLEGAGEPGSREARRIGSPHHRAREGHRARIRGQVAGDQVEGRRLTRAVRADQRRDAALLDREAAGVDRSDAAEALRQSLAPRAGRSWRHDRLAGVRRARAGARRCARRSASEGRMPRGRSSITSRKTAE